ncbi:MAG: caudovirus prohead protease [Eubacteriales bacterium]|nr:caudovirus prohead protease [Eubacteriales bacterium]
MDYDFSGWATRNDLVCSDGRTIRRDAFKDDDGKTCPLVWNHQHNSVDNVLGHALLENREDGVYAYCSFNDTASGQNAKALVLNGDVTGLSICANKLTQQGGNVLHGVIREVSLVLASANPGAFIEQIMAHGEETGDSAVIYSGEPLSLFHSDTTEEKKMAKENEKTVEDDKNKTLKEIMDSLTETQKTAVYAILGAALEGDDGGEDKEDDEDKVTEGGKKTMKHNVFDGDPRENSNVLSHSDQETVMKMAKSSQIGSFQTALQIYAEDNGLQHDAVSGGFVQTGEGNVTNLFPEYQEVRPGAPELITNDQGWITNVMRKVHKSPISRIRTSQTDIRNIDTLRAKGYQKGKEKKLAGNFKLVRRTTDPQTVYVKNALHRDDIVDITDFDYVKYLYDIDRLMLNEELAVAMMLGDGREEGDEGKIDPDKIRPIWTDDDLYTIHADLDIAAARKELQGSNTGANFGENYVLAEAMINAVLYAREHYKGTGTPDMYLTPHMLNVMLLARDINGRRIYATKEELASAFNVGEILTVEQFEGKTRKTADNKTKKLLAIITNLNDYSLGATKGGEVTHFTQFDIDFNQEKSLLETRCSGALTRVYSAIAIEEDVTVNP